MEAFAIKGLYGIEANTVRDSAAECWSDWLIESELTRDVSEARGYRCVPVQVTEIEPKPPIEVNSKSQLARITAQGGNAVPKAPK